MEMLDKALEAVVGLDGKPVVLDHPPENLNQIEFGTIGGQKVQEESLLFPDRNSGFELLACVNRRVVDVYWFSLTLSFDELELAS